MASHARLQFLRAGLFACVWLVCGAWSGRSADSLSPGATNVSGAEPAPVGAPTFQEQQDVIQQAIEQTRREVEAAAMRNVEALTQRLTLIQQSLETQHQREVEAVQRSNRTALMVAGALAATGLLGMFCLAFFLMRATNRLTEVAMAVPLSHALGTGYSPNVLTAGDSPLAVGNPTVTVHGYQTLTIQEMSVVVAPCDTDCRNRKRPGVFRADRVEVQCAQI